MRLSSVLRHPRSAPETRDSHSQIYCLTFIDLLIQHRSHLKAPWKWNKNGNMDPWANELSILNISRKSNSCTKRQHRAVGHDKNTWRNWIMVDSMTRAAIWPTFGSCRKMEWPLEHPSNKKLLFWVEIEKMLKYQASNCIHTEIEMHNKAMFILNVFPLTKPLSANETHIC